MKKILLLFVVMLLSIGAHAEIKMGEFKDGANRIYAISLITKKDKPYQVSIQCETKGNSKGEIWIKPGEIGKFREALGALAEKYSEWNQIASTNPSTDVTKEMSIKFPKVQFVWGRSTSFFGDGSFKANWIAKEGVTIVLCYAKIKASNNQFADELFTFKFFSVEDVYSLIDALSQEKLDEAISKLKESTLYK